MSRLIWSPRALRVIDFGANGYLALYRYDADSDLITVLAVRHQRELGY